MRHTAITSFFAMGIALATTNGLVAAGPGGTHAAGTPSAGSQSFGRPSIASPTTSGTSSGTIGTSGGSLGTGSSLSTGPSSPGTGVTPSNSGSPFGAGGLSNENSGYPMTPAEGGGEVSNNASSGTANTNVPQTGATANVPAPKTNGAILPYQGRWWYPLPNGHWVYWDKPTSSWVLFASYATGSASGADTNGEHSSGYRGLNNPPANAGANENPPSAANRWYWRNGQWFWFDGKTFQPAK